MQEPASVSRPPTAARYRRPPARSHQSCGTAWPPAPKLLRLFRAAGGSNRPGSHPSPAPRQLSLGGAGRPHTDTPSHPGVEAALLGVEAPGAGGAGRSGPTRSSPVRRREKSASGSGGREHARAQPNHGAGRGRGCAGARAQPNQGAGHRAPGWVRPRAGGCCSPLRSPERGRGRGAAAGPGLSASSSHSAIFPSLPRPPGGGLAAPGDAGPAHSAASLLGVARMHQPSSFGGDWSPAPSIAGAGLPPPRLSFLIGPEESSRLERDWLKPREQGWPAANPPVTSTRI